MEVHRGVAAAFHDTCSPPSKGHLMRSFAPAFLLSALTLTACSHISQPPASTPNSTSAGVSHDQIVERCVTAVARTILARPAGEPRPQECTSLSDSEYHMAYFKGVRKHNEDLRRQGGNVPDQVHARSPVGGV